MGAEVKLKATTIYWATTSEHLRVKKGGRGGTKPKVCNVKKTLGRWNGASAAPPRGNDLMVANVRQQNVAKIPFHVPFGA